MDEHDAALQLAEHYLDIGQPQRALDQLQHPSSEALENPTFWLLRGEACYALDRYEEAVEAARNGLAYAPEAIPLLYVLSNSEAERGNFSVAEEALLAALRQAPEQPMLLARYALLVGRAGQFPKAERLLAEATRIDPENAQVIRARGVVSYLRGNDKHAEQASRELLARHPEDAFGHYMLGYSLVQQGRTAHAHRALRNAAQLNPANEDIVQQARAVGMRTHWLMWPLWPLYRIGTIRFWIGSLVIFFGLRVLHLNTIASVFIIAYLFIVIYSWTVPFALRWWMRRR